MQARPLDAPQLRDDSLERELIETAWCRGTHASVEARLVEVGPPGHRLQRADRDARRLPEQQVLMPACLGASGSVRTTQKIMSAACAVEDQAAAPGRPSAPGAPL